MARFGSHDSESPDCLPFNRQFNGTNLCAVSWVPAVSAKYLRKLREKRFLAMPAKRGRTDIGSDGFNRICCLCPGRVPLEHLISRDLDQI